MSTQPLLLSRSWHGTRKPKPPANGRYWPCASFGPLKVKQGKEGEADPILGLLPRSEFPRLLSFLPEHVCGDILTHYRWRQTALGMITPLNRVRGRELTLEIERLFQSPQPLQLRARFLLMRAYIADRQKTLAHAQADVLLKEAAAPDPTNRSWWFDFWDEYSLLLRQEKQSETALAEIDKRLFKDKILRKECLPLLVERASLHSSLNRDEQAAKDLDEYLAQAKPGDFPVHFWTRACLVRGLLFEARGDLPNAVKAWRRGLVTKDGTVDWTIWPGGDNSLASVFHQIFLAHLCGAVQRRGGAAARSVPEIAGRPVRDPRVRGHRSQNAPEFAPEHLGPVMRKALDSIEGRRFIRQVAHGDLAYPELYEGFLILGFVHMSKRVLEPHQLSEGEEAMVRKLGLELYASVLSNKLTRQQFTVAAPLALGWVDKQPLPLFLGFDLPAQVFEPSMRGPIAYVFGLRYLHKFRKPKQAAEYFQRAFNLAPGGSQLRALAAAELARLK